MARTKGAKGKKTLAKEMGMTLEQYEEYLKSNNISSISSTFSTSIENFEGQITLFEEQTTQEQTTQELNKNKTSEIDLISDSDLISIPEPITKIKPELEIKKEKEIKETDLEITQEIIQETIQSSPELKPKSNKKSNIKTCDRCHSVLLCDTPKINLAYVTGLASYHRNINKDIIILCSKCAHKLNKIIEDFLIDNGNGMEEKF